MEEKFRIAREVSPAYSHYSAQTSDIIRNVIIIGKRWCARLFCKIQQNKKYVKKSGFLKKTSPRK